jgi:hypothetical protein
MNDSRYASRKFLIACASLLVAWAAVPLGLATADQVLPFTHIIVGLYFGANVVDDAATRYLAGKPA